MHFSGKAVLLPVTYPPAKLINQTVLSDFDRHAFDSNFVWGSAAYQIEGAVDRDGRPLRLGHLW